MISGGCGVLRSVWGRSEQAGIRTRAPVRQIKYLKQEKKYASKTLKRNALQCQKLQQIVSNET